MSLTTYSGIALILYAFTLCQPIFGQSQSGFHDPQPEYRPKFRYWLPDASVSSDIVANDFHAAKNAGAGGLELLPFYLYGMGEATFQRENFSVELPDWSKYGFGTPAFVDLFKHSLSAAKDAGILLDYAVGANQGQGVPSEVSTPGLAVELLMGNTTITPQGGFSAPVPQARQPSETILSGLGFQHPLEQFGTPNLTSVIAYQILSESGIDNTTGSRTIRLNESSFIDLMPLVKDGGTLQWTPPDMTKSWKIFSFWESFTNQRSCDGGTNATDFIGNGSWTVDHFSKTGATRVTKFWDEYILSDDEVAGLLKAVGNYAWEDSMEILSALYWTPGLLKRFKDTHNYDLTPYLPLLFSPTNTWNGMLPVYTEVYAFGNDMSVGNSVHQLDYRSILNDGYQDYLKHFEEWSQSIGTRYSAQPAYNLPLQMLSDIPLLDAPEGESLGFSELIDAYRQFSGTAHLANKSVISTELGAVNVAPYSLSVPSLLQKIKRSFSGGFTMHVIHGFPFSGPYSNTTWPGYTTFFYQFTEMWNEIQPAWQHMKDYLDFVGRNQWVLQQGIPKVDLALYLYASPWSPRTQYNSTNLQNIGFTYDYLGPDNLASSQASVENEALGIPQYKALVVNNQSVATVQAAEAMVRVATGGIPIIFVGAPPSQTYPVNTTTEAALTSTMQSLLSGPNVYRVDTIDQVPASLANAGVKPNVGLNCTSNPVYSVWRSSEDVDYVYLFNDQSKPADCAASIAASGVVPYTYNAWDGSSSPLLHYTTNNSTLTVPLAFKSNESIILALHRESSSSQCSFTTTSGSVFSLNTTDGHTQAIITGPATLAASSGKTLQLSATLPASTNLTTWDLVIEDWHSAPDRFAIQTEITNHTFQNIPLQPWNQIDVSLNPVSGIGHYTTNFTVPASTTNSSTLVGILKLPLIQHTARAYLDGTWLGPIDPNNPVVTLSDLESGTSYRLGVEVTTTLFNRIKAEANETMIVGRTAGSEQSMYSTKPYEGYGLVGSVVLEWGEAVDVEC